MATQIFSHIASTYFPALRELHLAFDRAQQAAAGGSA
jgi:hypothetical protein